MGRTEPGFGAAEGFPVARGRAAGISRLMTDSSKAPNLSSRAEMEPPGTYSRKMLRWSLLRCVPCSAGDATEGSAGRPHPAPSRLAGSYTHEVLHDVPVLELLEEVDLCLEGLDVLVDLHQEPSS